MSIHDSRTQDDNLIIFFSPYILRIETLIASRRKRGSFLLIGEKPHFLRQKDFCMMENYFLYYKSTRRLYNFGCHFKFWRFFEMLFYSAQFGRMNQRSAIFFWKFCRNLNLQVYFFNHTVHWAAMDALNNANSIGWKVSLLTKPQYVNTGTGTD